MSKVKRQHFVPQSYLQRWARADNANQIYIFDKEQKRSFSSAIKSVASTNYFYDFPSELHEHKDEIFKKAYEEGLPIDVVKQLMHEQGFEKTLSEIEGIANQILSRGIKKLENISAFPDTYEAVANYEIFSDEERDILAFFIALQYARTEEIRLGIEEMSEKLFKEYSWFIAQNLDKAQHDEELIKKVGRETVLDLKKAVDSGKWTKDSYTVKVDPAFIKIQHINLIFELTKEISIYLYAYKWLIYRNFTEQPFFTSDNPVVKKANMDSPFYSHGFQSKGIEVYFPLSPKYTLTILEPSYLNEYQQDLLYKNILDVTYSGVRYCNDIQIQSATNQIFSCENKFELAMKRVTETPNIAKKRRARFQVGWLGEKK